MSDHVEPHAVQGHRSNQKEAKAWLLNTIAGLGLQDAGLKRRKFAQYLPGGSAYDRQHEGLGRQLLQLLFQDEPEKVGSGTASLGSSINPFSTVPSQRASRVLVLSARTTHPACMTLLPRCPVLWPVSLPW
jgi:hypothetical protein